MYKQSQYNIVVDTIENDDILLFNTRTAALGIMDERSIKILSSIEQYCLSDLDAPEIRHELDLLIENGYIIEADANELDMLTLSSRIDKFKASTLTLTIAPTLDCNMACPYCYETHKKGVMNQNVQEVLFDFAVGFLRRHRCKYLYVTWFGGEPLLSTDVIRTLSKRFIDYCDKNAITYAAEIVTNGVLFDRGTAILLKEECEVTKAQVTIDGLPNEHNKRRLLKDGRKSFDIIIRNIDNCKDIIPINIRINVDRSNAESATQLCSYLLTKKNRFDNVSFYLSPVQNFSNNNIREDISFDARCFAEINTKVNNLLNSHLPDISKIATVPYAQNNYCAAVKYGNYVVDPDGDLYTCWSVIGIKEKSIGNITQRKPMNSEYAKWLLHEPSQKCTQCEMLPICAGGCPYLFYETGQAQCESKIFSLKDDLILAYRTHQNKKQASNQLLCK